MAERRIMYNGMRDRAPAWDMDMDMDRAVASVGGGEWVRKYDKYSPGQEGTSPVQGKNGYVHQTGPDRPAGLSFHR